MKLLQLHKKNLQHVVSLLFSIFCIQTVSWGQVTIFTETMGTTGGSVTIASVETANGFDNDGFTMSGTGDMRTTSPSSTYSGFSASANVFLTNTAGKNFIIAGINTTGYSSITLTFGMLTSVSGNAVTIEYSTDGTAYTALTLSNSTGTTWALASPTGTIPASATLYLKWTQPGTTAQMRIDDVKLVGTASTPAITLADNGTQVAAANVAQGTASHILHKSSLAVTTADATLTGMNCTTAGNYLSADLTNLKVWYSTDNAFGGDVLLSTYTTPGVAGAKTFPSFTSQAITAATTGYIFITADIDAGATTTNTISVNAIATTDLTFSSGTKSGSSTIGGTQTIVASAPVVPSLTTPTAASISTTGATLGATVTADGGAALTSRGTVWATTATPTTNAVAEGGTSVAAFTHARTGLTANTLYYYRGYAINSAGTGYSADGTFTTIHNAPTVGSGSAATSSSFTAAWTAPAGGGAAVYTYTIEVDDDNAFASVNFTQTLIASGTLTANVNSGLAASTTYYFRVKAVNAGGNSAWTGTSIGYATLAAPVASIAISSPGLGAANVSQGTTNHILFKLELAVTSANATLTGVSVTSGGTYAIADLSAGSFKLRYSTDNVLDGADATLSSIAIVGTGNTLGFTGLTQAITSGNTGFLFITCDVSGTATISNTINIASMAFTGITFSAGTKTGTDPVAAGGAQTIIASTSANVFISEVASTGYAADFNDEYIELTNNGGASQSLTGWTLEYYNATVLETTVALSGTLAANSAYLIAMRNTGGTINGLTPDVVVISSLNSNCNIILKDGSGTTVDVAGTLTSNPFSQNNFEFTDCSSDNLPTGNWVDLGLTSPACNGTPGVVNCLPPASEIDIKGSGISILDNDITPSTSDDTDFGNADVAGGTVDKTFTIYNTGSAVLSLSGASPYVVISGTNAADFSVTAIPSSSVNGGATSVFTIQFNPSATGLRTATLTITSNDSNEGTYNFDIQGTGTNSNLSNIIRNTGFTEPSNIAYASYQETNLLGTSLEVARFDIQDGGGSADADALGTTLSAITFSLTNWANIRRCAIYDGTTEIEDVAVSSGTVSFSTLGTLAAAADGVSKTFCLRISFNTAVTDNQQFQFTVTSATANSSGSIFAAAAGGGAQSSITTDRNRIEVSATSIAYGTQPVNGTLSTNMTTFTINAVDASGNTDLDNSTCTVALTTTGTGFSSATPYTFASGVITVNSAQYSSAQTVINITATAQACLGSAAVTSNNFDIAGFINGDYRTIATTGTFSWSNTANWEKYDGVTAPDGFIATTTLPVSTRRVWIRCNVTPVPSLTIKELTINNGCTLTSANAVSVSDKLLIKSGGTFVMNAFLTMDNDANGSTFEIEDTGTFEYSNSNSTPLLFQGIENFHPNSNFVINNWSDGISDAILTPNTAVEMVTTNTYNGYTAAFGNFYYRDLTGADAFLISNVGAVSFNFCHGNLEVETTLTDADEITLIQGSQNIGIGGNVIVKDGHFVFNSCTTCTSTITIEGDLIVQGNNAARVSINSAACSGNINVDLKGNLDVSGTNTKLVGANPADVDKDFGFLRFVGPSTVGAPQTIDFDDNGDGTPTNVGLEVTIESGSVTKIINQNFRLGNLSTLNVKNGGTFDFGFDGVNGAGTTALNLTEVTTNTTAFTLEENGILRITSTDGISAGTALLGNVQMTAANKLFNQTATFWYIGKANQVTGDAITTSSTNKTMKVETNANNLTVSLTNSITAGRIDFIFGRFLLGTMDLILGIPAIGTQVGGSSDSYAITDAAGVYKRTQLANSTDYLFPIGPSNTSYNPATLNYTGTVDNFSSRVEVGTGVGFTTYSTGGSDAYFVNRVWHISEATATGTTASLTLQWEPSHENGSFARATCGNLHYQSSPSTGWLDSLDFTSRSVTVAPYNCVSPNVTDFSPFSVGKAKKSVLPIELLSFTAKLNDKIVDLNWATASEINNDYFTIERSADAVNFEAINTTDGAGNSSQILFYTSHDANPLSGVSYYRLKQTDFNGAFSYSHIVAIEINNMDGFQLVNTFNSIEHGSLDVTVNCGNSCMVNFELFDMTGKKVYASTQNVLGNNKTISIPTSTLSNGIYLLKAYNGRYIISKKVKL